MSDFEKYIEAKYPNRSPKILFQKFEDIDGTLFYGVKEIEDQAEVWNYQQTIINDLKAQLCKAHERLELIQEEFVETETYLKEQIEQKNSKITSFEYLVEQNKIHIQSQQSRVVDLKAQLECCRKENAVLQEVMLRDSALATKAQLERNELQGQMENIEACYIEKKKQVEVVSHMLEEDLKYVEQDRRGNFDFLQMAMIRCLGDAIKTLRGES